MADLQARQAELIGHPETYIPMITLLAAIIIQPLLRQALKTVPFFTSPALFDLPPVVSPPLPARFVTDLIIIQPTKTRSKVPVLRPTSTTPSMATAPDQQMLAYQLGTQLLSWVIVISLATINILLCGTRLQSPPAKGTASITELEPEVTIDNALKNRKNVLVSEVEELKTKKIDLLSQPNRKNSLSDPDPMPFPEIKPTLEVLDLGIPSHQPAYSERDIHCTPPNQHSPLHGDPSAIWFDSPIPLEQTQSTIEIGSNDESSSDTASDCDGSLLEDDEDSHLPFGIYEEDPEPHPKTFDIGILGTNYPNDASENSVTCLPDQAQADESTTNSTSPGPSRQLHWASPTIVHGELDAGNGVPCLLDRAQADESTIDTPTDQPDKSTLTGLPEQHLDVPASSHDDVVEHNTTDGIQSEPVALPAIDNQERLYLAYILDDAPLCPCARPSRAAALRRNKSFNDRHHEPSVWDGTLIEAPSPSASSSSELVRDDISSDDPPVPDSSSFELVRDDTSSDDPLALDSSSSELVRDDTAGPSAPEWPSFELVRDDISSDDPPAPGSSSSGLVQDHVDNSVDSSSGSISDSSHLDDEGLVSAPSEKKSKPRRGKTPRNQKRTR